MGAGIASANVKRGLPTRITDSNPEGLRKGMATALETAAFAKDKGGPDPARIPALAALLSPVAGLDGFADADLVIEAVVENVEVKAGLLRQVESVLRPEAILASNTSTISISRLAEGLENPARFCGIHFFSPVHRMQLVEVIRGRRTSDETVLTAVAYAKRLGKLPVVVNDSPGFLVNRLLLPYMIEALEVLLEGAGISQVDRALREFGMPMGPLTLYDVVGIDTACYAGSVMHAAFPDRMNDSALLAEMLRAGRLGQKTGKGFYRYENGSLKGVEDPDLEPLLAPLRTGNRGFTHEEIVARLMLPMVLEATRVLEEGVVRSPFDVDAGMVLGTGFPPFRGGVCFWADTVGAGKLLEQLRPLAERSRRYQPTPALEEMARSGRGFYARYAGRKTAQEVSSS
jgi:3-hydroxyacyl-CoA dehydrogenase/enoyl-CoA hydratase/3-hydroxybutyryl-CoA epimerase/3-hydroxyacyl-CoA dehydrogenase/enoyl-CoA hydratase/3-hydroxybutyryl-CoA epimerase/enoyl-CoA isomerase